MSEDKRPTGRPPIYDDNDGSKFHDRGMEYIEWCRDNGKRPTVNGLALALGFRSRQSLLNYEDRGDSFLDSLNKLRLIIESEWEYALADNNVAGTIFWLKNQGWSDKQETELYGRAGKPVETVTTIRLVGRED